MPSAINDKGVVVSVRINEKSRNDLPMRGSRSVLMKCACRWGVAFVRVRIGLHHGDEKKRSSSLVAAIVTCSGVRLLQIVPELNNVRIIMSDNSRNFDFNI